MTDRTDAPPGEPRVAPMTAGQLCLVCDKPISGRGVRVEQFSASGARPDDWRHDSCYRSRR